MIGDRRTGDLGLGFTHGLIDEEDVRGEERRGGLAVVVMEVPMEPEAADEIMALREQLRQVQGKVEHLRRVGWEQSRSLAVTVPHLNSAVELSLKVSGA